MAFVAAATTAIPWVYFAAIDPTIGGALIAACASIVTVLLNAALLRRHERHVDERFAERRNVFVKGTPDDPEALLVTGEDRRGLEDRRLKPESRKERGRRHRERRK